MEQLKSLTPTHTCVVAIHHLSLAYKFCDEVILLNKGNVIAYGETQCVLTAENLAKTFSICWNTSFLERRSEERRKVGSKPFNTMP